MADHRRRARVQALLEAGYWPPVLPSVVLVETLRGHGPRDADTWRLAATCDVVTAVPEGLASRAAQLRARAGRGSAVDALVVAVAADRQPATVMTSDPDDIKALAEHAGNVAVRAV